MDHMTEEQKEYFLARISALLDVVADTEMGDQSGAITPAPYADWLHPMPMAGKLVPVVTSGFSRDGSGPNKHRYNHWGVDIMYREQHRVRPHLPSSDGTFCCPKGLPAINVAPGRVIMVHPDGRYSLTVEHVVPGVGQVLVHHKHLDRIYVDKGELVAAGHHLGMAGTAGTDLRHDHFEVHEGRLGGDLKGAAWWKMTAIDPAPILRELTAVTL